MQLGYLWEDVASLLMQITLVQTQITKLYLFITIATTIKKKYLSTCFAIVLVNNQISVECQYISV